MVFVWRAAASRPFIIYAIRLTLPVAVSAPCMGRQLRVTLKTSSSSTGRKSVVVVTATNIASMTLATARRLLGGRHLRLHVKAAADSDDDSDDPDPDAIRMTPIAMPGRTSQQASLAVPFSIPLIVGDPGRGLVGVHPDMLPELYVMCSQTVAERASVCSIEVGVEAPAGWGLGTQDASAASDGLDAAIERLRVPAEDDQRSATLHNIAVVFLRSRSPSAQHAAMRLVGMVPDTDPIAGFEQALVERAKYKPVPRAPAAPKRRRPRQPATAFNDDDFDALGAGELEQELEEELGHGSEPVRSRTATATASASASAMVMDTMLMDSDVGGRHSDAVASPPAKVPRSGSSTWGGGGAAAVVDDDIDDDIASGFESDDDFGSLVLQLPIRIPDETMAETNMETQIRTAANAVSSFPPTSLTVIPPAQTGTHAAQTIDNSAMFGSDSDNYGYRYRYVR